MFWVPALLSQVAARFEKLLQVGPKVGHPFWGRAHSQRAGTVMDTRVCVSPNPHLCPLLGDPQEAEGSALCSQQPGP